MCEGCWTLVDMCAKWMGCVLSLKHIKNWFVRQLDRQPVVYVGTLIWMVICEFLEWTDFHNFKSIAIKLHAHDSFEVYM